MTLKLSSGKTFLRLSEGITQSLAREGRDYVLAREQTWRLLSTISRRRYRLQQS